MDAFRTKSHDGFQAEFGWLFDDKNHLIPGGYYDAQGNRLRPESKDMVLRYPHTHREYLQAQRQVRKACEDDYRRRIADAVVKRGKRILILSYEIEPPIDLNISFNETPDCITYISRVMARILSGEDNSVLENAYYYKISALEGGFIPEETISNILSLVNPDFVLVIGDDLIYRFPLIEGDGPKLEIENGLYAETVLLSYNRKDGSPVICIPMPHPGSPGFDEEAEQNWHQIMVELFKH